MKISMDIPDDILEDIDEEIIGHSNESCSLGSLPSSGYWAEFQALWDMAIINAKNTYKLLDIESKA